MSLTQRIPELEATSEPRDTSETATEAGDKRGNPSEADQRRSWLYRFFFGP
jgi:hypothetical protein